MEQRQRDGMWADSEAVCLLKDLLAIPSVNGQNDEGAVARYLCRYMREAGLEAQVQEIDETHANVIAVLKGEEKTQKQQHPIVWNGHLDTVPYGKREEWETDPAIPTERDGFLYARGASDMKSGLAAMVYALCAFARAGKKPKRTVRFLGTCDEERGGLGARRILEEGLLGQPEELLVGEPTGCRMGVAQKGCLWLELHISGRTSHGAYPEEGCNAIEAGFCLAAGIRTFVEGHTHPVLGRSTAQITQITGGVAPNMTPDHCILLMDIRMTPGLTGEMILAEAERLARTTDAYPQVEFQIKNHRRAIEIAFDHPMTKRLEQSIKKHGLEAGMTGINYFTDASILAAEREELPVLLFGPGEPGMAHKPNERVSLAMYQKAIEVLTELLESEE